MFEKFIEVAKNVYDSIAKACKYMTSNDRWYVKWFNNIIEQYGAKAIIYVVVFCFLSFLFGFLL